MVETKEKRLSEEERILEAQIELFPMVDEKGIQRTLSILKKYPELKVTVEDYKNHYDEIQQTIIEGEAARKLGPEDLHSDKTANSVILIAINQKKAAEECDLWKKSIERAMGLIIDKEARDAVYYRYIKGCSYKETLYFMHRGVKSATVDRRLKTGIISMANTFSMWGLLAEK